MDVLILLALLSPAVLGAKVLHLVVTQRLMLSRRLARQWAEGVVLCACVGLPVFVFSLFVGFFPDEACTSPRGRSAESLARLDGTFFPRSVTCRWDDGSSTELIPMWVNPLIFASIAGVLVCTVLAGNAVIRKKETEDHE